MGADGFSAWICRAWSHVVTRPGGQLTAFWWRPKTSIGEVAVAAPLGVEGGAVVRFASTDEVGRTVVDLPAAQAWKLAEQILVLVACHPSGDQRPSEEDRIAVLPSHFAVGLYQADEGDMRGDMVRVVRREAAR